MDKDEILEKSRKENKQQDIFELEVINKGSSIAMRVGLFVCCLISIISAVFITDDYWIVASSPCWTIYFSMLGTLFVYKFAKRKKRHELFFGVMYYIIAAFMFIRFALFIAGIWS